MTQLTLPQTAPITQEEINGILWRACDTFRGTVDPAEYKNYILVMLFVKYISDVWRDHYDTLLARYNGDEVRARRMMRHEKFVLPDGCDFLSLYEQRNAPNLGEIINKALEKVEEANKDKLEGVFRNIDFNSEAALGRARERNERLRNLGPQRPGERDSGARRTCRLHCRAARRDRRCLRVSHRALCGGRGQEGRRVLHPARSLDVAGAAARAAAGRAPVRPGGGQRITGNQVCEANRHC
jgi:hypothetical protein